MSNNITVKDASNNNIQIHTIEDSTSVHYNMSIPITVSGIPIFTTAAPGVVSLADSVVGVSISPTQANIPVSIAGTPTVNATQSGTWNTNASVVGSVSVFVDQVPFNVSINNSLPVPVSIVGGALTIADNAPVSVRGGVLGAVSLGGGSANIGTVSISPTQANIPVSLGALGFNLPTSVANTVNVSINSVNTGIPNADGQSLGGATQGHLNVRNTNMVFNRNSSTWDRMTGTSVGIAVLPVSVSPQVLTVHVCNALPAAGATLVVSVGGVTSTQAVPIAFRDTGGDARQPLLTTGGALIVHVCNAQAAPSSDVSVSPTQGSIPVSIAGGAINIADNAPVSVRGGRVSIADSTLAATQSGTWTVQPGNTANTTPWLVSVNGIPKVSVADSTLAATQSGTWNVGLNAGTALVGAVSISPNGLNIPVSIAALPDNAPVSVRGGRVSIADSTLAATQSGTWNVGINAGTNLIGAVSVRGAILGAVSIANIADVSVQDNAPVSVRGGVLGAVSLGGGSAQIGSVVNAAGTNLIGAVSVRQIVSVVWDGANANAPVSVAAGRVSVQGLVTVDAKSNTGAAIPAGAFFVGGTDGTNLRGLLTDALGALEVRGQVTNAESSFTRPADTTAYASGDLVGNSTTAGSVTPLAFPVSKYTTGGGTIFVRRAKIVKSTGSLTNANFRLHLYNTSNGVTNQGVSVVGGDNAAYTASKVSAYLGYISVAMAVSHSDGAAGWGMPEDSMEMNVKLASSQFNIQGLLEVRGAYTPGNTERFNVYLEAYQE